MKTRKKLSVLLCALTLAFTVQCVQTLAAEGNREVPVTYSPTEESLARFEMQVIIKGEGSVMDGTIELKNTSSVVYELKYGEQKTFQVKPAPGYRIASIVYDGKDITSQLVNGFITVTGMDYPTVLTFTYEKIKSDNGNEGNKPDTGDNGDKPDTGNNGNKDTPNTGDHTNLTRFMVLGSVSAIMILILLKRKKDQEDENEDQA